MKKKSLLLLLFLLTTLNTLYSINFPFKDNTTDFYHEGDFEWLKQYVTVDQSDDIHFKKKYGLKNYRVEEDYVKYLKWRNQILFYHEDYDKYNIRQNSNNMPFFPLVIMPLGNVFLQTGKDFGLKAQLLEFGFLFRHDNVKNSHFSVTGAVNLAHNNVFSFIGQMETPLALQDQRLRFFSNFNFFTSSFLYSAEYMKNKDLIYDESDKPSDYHDNETTGQKIGRTLLTLFNSVFRILDMEYNDINRTGFSTINGINLRVPVLEMNSVSAIELEYQYFYRQITDNSVNSFYDYPPQTANIQDHAFNINVIQEFTWNKQKQTPTLLEGNLLSLKTKMILPTYTCDMNTKFRFESTLEERLTLKLFREFAVKGRLLVSANYNRIKDFSGEPYLRAHLEQEVMGFFGLFANIELLAPLMMVRINRAVGKELRKDANFILYFSLFFDGGFAIDYEESSTTNYHDFVLDNQEARENNRSFDTSISNFDKLNLGNGFTLVPAFSVGAGLRAHPFFMHFVIRLDVSVNILRIIFDKIMAPDEKITPTVEIGISFNEMF
ncbi:MAG: hypothetical protein MJB14_01275 [Spirochaetes bacterium]|nr:hypothetical protein [Spirochaetota bacterium]